MALSRLARLALNNVSASPPDERIETYRLVSLALGDDCRDLADLALKAAHGIQAAAEAEQDLLTSLQDPNP